MPLAILPGVPGPLCIGHPAACAALASAAREAGARFASYTLVRLPWTVKPVFQEWLDRTQSEAVRDKVSSLILHDAKQSVLCVPASAHLGNLAVPRFRVVVVATDLSDFGNHAAPYGYPLLGDRGGEVHLVHVRDEDHEGADADAIEQRLHRLIPTTAAGVITRTHVVTGDDTARVIGETAERLGADVVVIASHARGGISRAILGSVADKLLRMCRRPVLVLRPPAE